MIFVIWLAVLVVTLSLYLRKVYSRFSDYGVNNLPIIPLLGNAAGMITRKCHIVEEFNILYHSFPNDRFVGRFEIIRPTVMIRDLELIKKITVKDFEHFVDHRPLVDDNVDTLFGKALISMRGQEWKDMRSTLSPAFTSSKIRNLVPFMVDVNKQMINMIKRTIEQSGTDFIDIECKDLTGRYANDVIASCAFGLKVDSHVDKTNEFYLMGKSTAHFGLRRIMVYLGYSVFPGLMKKFKIQLFEDVSSKFFKNLVLTSMMNREEKKINRPDMIHLLMEAKKGKLTMSSEEKTADADAGFATVQESDIGKNTISRSWSDDDLVAQAFLFFLAGFETVSTTMSFLFYELAVNPDIQERLVREIQEDSKRNGGKFDYSSIQNLTYMDMVISEVLRMWPPAIAMDRSCTKDYNMGRPNDKAKRDFILRKGESISIPTFSIHRDPNNFPDPDKFDPERFSSQNKNNIKSGTYVPFGIGPRNCIGSRFALCEVKVMLYQVLQQLEVSPCAKTSIPAKLTTETFTLGLDGGTWVRLALRK